MDLYSIRRKNNSSKKGSIFPLVSQLLPDDAAPQLDPIGSKFCIFEGDVRDGVVMVSNKDHAKDIYSGGFFGKGSCSYGEPRFDGASHDRVMQALYGQHTEETNHAVESISGAHVQTNHLQQTTDCEELILSAEEAFFLAFGLGVLRVKRSGNDISLDELYTYLFEQDHQFPLRYSAYHHFRHKGWVVRPGTSLGVDFLLYKDGPPFTHSSFMVLIRTDEDAGNAESDIALEELTEHRLDVMTRISGSVQKVLLLCYVLMPPETDLSQPGCLRQMEVCEIITSRWETNKK